MIKGISSRVYNISAALTCNERKAAIKYIQEAVEEHCRLYPRSPFSVRILFGGEKRNWEDTPLQRIYDHYIDNGRTPEKAARAAAIDVGRLMKKIIEESLDTYEYAGRDTGNKFVRKNTANE